MAEAIPTGPQALNQPADQMLKQARAEAMSSLPGNMVTHLNSVEGPSSPTAQPQTQAIPPAEVNPQLPVNPNQQKPYDPDLDSVDISPVQPLEPIKDAVDVPAVTHGTGDIWSARNAREFIRDAFKGSGTEIANSVPRLAAKLGGLAVMGGAGLATMVDHAVNGVTGKSDSSLADRVFKFKEDYINPAIESWTPERAQNTGEGEGSGGAAQFIGEGVGMVPMVFAGPAGIAALISQAGSEGATQSLDAGHSLSSAAATGAVDALTTLIMTKIASANPSMVKRILSGIAGSDLVQIASNITKKGILIAEGRQQDADNLSPFEGLGEASFMGGAFGFHKKPGKSSNKSEDPIPGAVDVPPVGGEPPPPSEPPLSTPPEPGPAPLNPQAEQVVAQQPTPPAAGGLPASASNEAVAPATAAPVSPAEVKPTVSPVADTPSAEPTQDLMAQFDAVSTKGSDRTGVFVPKAGMDALATSAHPDAPTVKAIIKKAQAEGRTVNTGNGHLILATRDAALKAKEALKNGEDPQAVIGRITGAGKGKALDQTAVVQGQTPEGAVVKESAVRPDEIPAKVAEVKAEGQTPVVTTPEAAIARREKLVAAEPKVGSTEPKMGLAQVGKQELPVHIEEGAPEGMTRVRPLDEQGEPGKLTHDVPSEKVRTQTAADLKAAAPDGKQEPGANVAAEPPAPETPVEQPPAKGVDSLLETALNAHIKQEDIPPSRKKAMPLTDRQDNTSSFAAALLHSAKQAEGKASDATIDRAVKAANAGINMGIKTADATRKGRGTSHARIDAINEEMHKAARELLGKAKSGDEVPAVAPKAAALKARKAREKVAAEKPPAAPKPKSAAARAREEVTAAHPQEDALQARLIKKRTAELEAEAAKAKKEAVVEMVKAPVFKEEAPITETVSSADVRKAKLKAQVARDQAEMSGHETHKAEAEAARAKYEALQDQYYTEHPDQAPAVEVKTVGEQLKAKKADRSHAKLVEDYINAEERELPELFDEVIASAERRDGQKMSEADRAAAKAIMDNHREISKLTQEQAEDGFATRTKATAEDAMRSSNPLMREMGKLHKKLLDSGFYKKLADVRASGSTISTHEVIRDLIAQSPNPLMHASLMKLLSHAPDIPLRPAGSVLDPRTGKANPLFHGMFTTGHNWVQIKLEPGKVFTTESIIHEILHSATAYELHSNPNGLLATELNKILAEVRARAAKVYGQKVIDEHQAYFEGKGPQPVGANRDLYGLTNILELTAETFSNPDFQRFLISLDKGTVAVAGGRRPNILGRIATAITKWLGEEHATPLFERIMDLTGKTMEIQSESAAYGYVYEIGVEQHEKYLPISVKNHIFSDAMASAIEERQLKQQVDRMGLAPEEVHAMASLGSMEEPPPLRGVDAEIKKHVGEDATKLIRKLAAGKGRGIVDALRAAVPAITGYAQMMRRRMSDFGHVDDPKNPLRMLEEADDGRSRIQNEIIQRSKPIAEARVRLGLAASTKLGQLQMDSTTWGIDPSKPKDEQTHEAQSSLKFDEQYAEFAARWKNTSPEAQEVFRNERDALQWLSRKTHRAGVDVALRAYESDTITPAQRALLYNVRDPAQYDNLIGPRKLIDLGDRNVPLVQSLKFLANARPMEGPYFPLARHGDMVVHVAPEGSKAFATEAEANAFAKRVDSLSPQSSGEVSQRGGKWVVDYKADYTSMHEKKADAEADAARMRALGFDVPLVTQKTFSGENPPMTLGGQDLLAEATRRLRKDDAAGQDNSTTETLVETLRSTFLRMIASRSSYAGSKLARKATGGVKAEEMGRNFAEHMQAGAWHTASLAGIFKQAEALAAVRAAARDTHAQVSQATMYRRGKTVEELGRRMQQELADYGKKTAGATPMARVGFANYLAHPSQTVINMTQNFVTAIPVASVRYGTAKATSAFGAAMKLIASPSFKGVADGVMRGATGHDILLSMIKTVRGSPRYAKWANGENSPLEQLLGKNVIDSTMSNELGEMAKGNNPFWTRTFEYARLGSNMSELFNRMSSALAMLELTNGNVRASADFIRETHFDYSPGGQPRAFKAIRKLPVLGPSIVMFKTYAQGMAHLYYTNVRDAVMGAHNAEGSAYAKRAEAAKTVAALTLSTALFAGIKGATPELVHLMSWAYNKVFGDKDEYFNLDNAMHRLIAEEFGKGAAANAVFKGLPTLLGADVSNNMGLNSLILQNPPDILHADGTGIRDFLFQASGSLTGFAATEIKRVSSAWDKGDYVGAVNAAVPVRAYQDALKAFNIYSGGSTTDAGNMVTEPGNLRATGLQAFGFTPSEVAKARERTSDAIEYGQFVKDRRNALLKQFSNGPVDSVALDKFNKANPGRMITRGEIIKYKRFAQQSSTEAMGGQSRNPDTNKLLDY